MVQQAKVVLLAVVWLGCGSSSVNKETTVLYGDTTGTFYSLAIKNRFEAGENLEIVHGKELYQQYCVICHGESGDGNGFNAYNLKSNFGVQPFDFTDSSAVAQLLFDEIEKAVAFGGPAVGKSPYMPPWGETLNAYDLACLDNFVWHVLMRK